MYSRVFIDDPLCAVPMLQILVAALLPPVVCHIKFVRKSVREDRLDEKGDQSNQFYTIAGCKNSDKTIEYCNAVTTAFCSPIVKYIHYSVSSFATCSLDPSFSLKLAGEISFQDSHGQPVAFS